jgi:phytoene synthase
MALGDTARRYPLPMSALHELVEGCRMDVEGTTYRTFDDLVVYCRHVAGTVGRLSLGIYGSTDPDRATALADALGVALQITNILRDVVEDRDTMGRVYLPADDLARFGLDPRVGGDLDRRSRACTAAMAGIYRRLLRRIQRDPAAILAGRLSLPATHKAAAAWQGLAWGRA